MKLRDRIKNTDKKKVAWAGILSVVLVLAVIAAVLVLHTLKGQAQRETETAAEAESTAAETTHPQEDPEKLLEELGEETYAEEELALDDSEENEKYEETEQTEQTESSVNSEYPYYIMVNRQENCVTIYGLDNNGAYTIPVKAMVCSVGVSDGTPLGTFQTSDKYTWRYLYGNVYGQYAYRIYKNILFHSVPYYTKNKDDLESEEYNKLGEAASLGCIRLSVADAKWLIDNCPSGTTVTIYDSSDPGPLGKPTAQKIDLTSSYKGWDPTDPSDENPWKTILANSTTSASSTASTRLTTKTIGKSTTKSTAKSTTKSTVKTTGTTRATTAATTAASASETEGVKISAPSLITINLRQKNAMEEAILSQITVTENKAAVEKGRIRLDLSSLSGQTYGTFTVDCRVTDSKGYETVKSLTVLLDLAEPVIGGGNRTVTASSEAELLAAVKDGIWVTDNSGEDCTLTITYTKTGQTTDGGGIYQIRVTAVDAAGNQGVETLTYTVYGM
jgi:lipoprotein-anchoring transpeptidase ErfK/SrfK